MKTNYLILLFLLTGLSNAAADILTDIQAEETRILNTFPEADQYWQDNIEFFTSYIETYDLYRVNFLLRSIEDEEFHALFRSGFMDHLTFFITGILKYEKDKLKVQSYLAQNPKLALYSFPFYKDQTYALPGLLSICESIPNEVIENYDLWIESTFAQEIIDKLAKTSPKQLAQIMHISEIREFTKNSDSSISQIVDKVFELSGPLSNTYLLLEQLSDPEGLTFEEAYRVTSDNGKLNQLLVENFTKGSLANFSIAEYLLKESGKVLEKPDTSSLQEYFIHYLLYNDQFHIDDNIRYLNILRNSKQLFLVNFNNPQMLEALFSTFDLIGQFGYYNALNQIIEIRQRDPLEQVYLDKRTRYRFPYEVFDRGFNVDGEKNTLRFKEKDRFLLHLKNSSDDAIHSLRYMRKDPLARQFLDMMCSDNAAYILRNFDHFNKEPYGLRFLEKAVLQDPALAKEYMSSESSQILAYLKRCRSSRISKLVELHTSFGMLSNSYLLVDMFMKDKINAEEAHTTGFYKDLLFKNLVELRPAATYGIQSIDKHLSYYILTKIRELNDEVEKPVEQVVDIKGFSAAELYFYIVYGEEELLNTTFNRLYQSFKSVSSLDENFFATIGYFKIETFLKVCSHHMVLEDFIKNFNQNEKEELISKLLNREINLSRSVEIAELISSMSESKFKLDLLKEIQSQKITASKENATDQYILFSLLQSAVSDSIQSNSDEAINSISYKDLQDKGTMVQWQFFYDDEDGRFSYQEFIKMYSSNQSWKIEEFEDFSRIYSLSGNKIEILSNKPTSASKGVTAIKEYLKSRQIEESMIIHRGYSFHSNNTINNISDHIKLVFLGSCGGYYKVSDVMKRAPNAHVISTRQVATYAVNNPLLSKINEELRIKGEINWKSFWQKTSVEMTNTRFKDYVPPHKNFSHRFINSYYHVLGI